MKDKTVMQALVLGLGQITGKILSLIFLFRFANDLGKTGMSLYAYAYIPFSIFSDLSCIGLIPGTSKLVSKLNAQNEEKKVAYLLHRGIKYTFFVGLCFFLFMLFFSRQILSFSLFDGFDEESFEIIRTNLLLASLSLFLIPIINFFRGFLQGHLVMYPSSISIILENVFKLVCYLFIINYFKNTNLIHTAFLIYFAGYFISFILLFIFILPYYKKEKEHFFAVKELLKMSIPFGIATMFFTIYQFIDSITLSIMLPKEGYYTAYMFETIRLIFFPIVIAQALGGALNPKLNYMFKEDRIEEAKNIAIKCSKMIIYILIPLMFIMRYFATEIYQSFYHQENGEIILYHISSLIIFLGLYKVLIGISLGLPKGYFIVISTIIGAICKVILNILFIPQFGYLGAIYATIIVQIICILAAYAVLNMEGIKIFWHNFKSIICSCISVFLSFFLVIIFRVVFLLNHYPIYYTVILYSILILGFYYIFLHLIQQKKPKRIE